MAIEEFDRSKYPPETKVLEVKLPFSNKKFVVEKTRRGGNIMVKYGIVDQNNTPTTNIPDVKPQN